MNDTIILQDENGNEITGKEVLGITVDEDMGSIEAGSYISIIDDGEGNLYPMKLTDDETMELVEDEQALEMIETILETVLAGIHDEDS